MCVCVCVCVGVTVPGSYRTKKNYNDTKVKDTMVNKTRQQKFTTRLIAHQSAPAYATEKIKVNGG